MDATVHRLAHQAAKYLNDLGLPATELTKARGRALPYYLADAFELVEIEIVGHLVTLAIDQEEERSPAEAEQLLRKLGNLVESPPIYVTGSLSSYDRKRFIERHVSFLVPGNQLYLPALGMDLRERFRKPVERRQLSPSAQAMLITVLQHPDWTRELTATEIAARLDYTPMTASRAARELAGARLAELNKSPSGQHITLVKQPRDIWEMALPLMRSPVQRTVYAKMFAFQPPPSGLEDIVTAGMTELAQHTMLASEGPRVLACTRESWNSWKEYAEVLPRPDANADEVQIWSYPPRLANGRPHMAGFAGADPLSLYLSLRDTDDPRVQSALGELMEQVWQ